MCLLCQSSICLSLKPPRPPLTALPCRLHRRRSSWTGRSCTLCWGACLPRPTVTWRSTSWSPSCTWPSGSCAPSLGLCRGPRCFACGTCSSVRVRYYTCTTITDRLFYWNWQVAFTEFTTRKCFFVTHKLQLCLFVWWGIVLLNTQTVFTFPSCAYHLPVKLQYKVTFV